MTTTADTTEITKTLTEYLVGLKYDELPTDVVETVKLYSLECVGHMIRAQSEQVSKIVLEYIRMQASAPQALVIGTGLRTSVGEAAYANGTAAHANELESHGTLPGTGLVPPIAAAVSVSDWLGSVDGKAFITAIVAGVEMQGRLGAAGIGACDRGFMGISLVGPGAAAMTSGRLLGLDADRMQHCLGVALPLGNGSTRGCGYMTHVHEAGIPTRSGVFAAQLAAAGFTGCPDYLDGPNSWGNQYAGGSARPYRPEALTDGLGETFFLQTSDVSPKQYGSCGLTHQAMEGMIDLISQHGLTVDEIESVDLLVPPWADRIASFREPQNGEQAKFSIRQGVAGLLVDGVAETPYLRPFSDDTCNDPRYVEARKRVRLDIVDGLASERAFVHQKVTLHLRDGRSLSTAVDHATMRGHVANPFTVEERLDMVRHTVARIGDDRTEQLIDLMMHIEDHALDPVMALLSTIV
jgi:2-methylcitrate dehydratase PrpD